MSDTSWEKVLPKSGIELWVLRIAMMVFIFMSGFGAGLYYTQNNFEKGLNYMQKVLWNERQK